LNAGAINDTYFKELKYGGFLTVSQSGKGEQLMKAMRLAFDHHLTCFNIVNIEDSPITQSIDNFIKEDEEKSKL